MPGEQQLNPGNEGQVVDTSAKEPGSTVDSLMKGNEGQVVDISAKGAGSSVDSLMKVNEGQVPGKKNPTRKSIRGRRRSTINSRMKSGLITPNEEEFSKSDRRVWPGRWDFLLVSIGLVVGNSNICRFPHLLYSNGGGAFLIVYATFLVICGLPLLALEFFLGQFASLTPITIWRICPIFKGIGYGMIITGAIGSIHYIINLAWNLYFLFNSMRHVLPWTLCGKEWNTAVCMQTSHASANGSGTFGTSSAEYWNDLGAEENWNCRLEGNRFNVLEISTGIDDIGGVRWSLFCYLFSAWCLVFVCLFKGIGHYGKVVHVTVASSFMILVMLLTRSVMLPGAYDGIMCYIIPEWGKLLSSKVWRDAAAVLFYSIDLGSGNLMTMSSYNKFNTNIFRDALILPLIDFGTSLLVGFIIFSVLGFMSHETGVEVSKMITSGPGLIYGVYPEAVALMPAPQLWATLFYFMVFLVVLDSQFALFNTLISSVIDEYPHFLRNRKATSALLICALGFLLGIPMICQGGIYLFTLVGWYAFDFTAMVVAMLECLILSWIYGVDRFRKDIELMIGYQPNVFWRTMWKFITPFTVCFLLLSGAGTFEVGQLGLYKYPSGADIMGRFCIFVSLIPLPIFAALTVYRGKGTLTQRFRKAIQPTHQWGPAGKENKQKYVASLTGRDRDRFEAALKDMDMQSYLKAREMSRSALIEEIVNYDEGNALSQENNEVPDGSEEDTQVNIVP